jgi:hypothetical protein
MITGGVFTHRNIRKRTWLGPDDRTMNQINHVMIDQSHRLNVLDVRIYRNVDVDSDRCLVIARLRFRIVRRNIKKQ